MTSRISSVAPPLSAVARPLGNQRTVCPAPAPFLRPAPQLELNPPEQKTQRDGT